MEYPKAYAQYRTDFRGTESERRVFYWLREFFTKVGFKVISSVYYYLFGKNTIYGTDPYQFNGSIQISNNGLGFAPYLNLVKTGGTETSYTNTPAEILGYIAGTGYTGSSFFNASTIQFQASESWTPTTCGAYILFKTTPTGTTSFQDSGFIAPTGSWASGTGSLATNATSGFLYIPTCAGVPTGVPESINGRLPIVIDSTNNKAYIYSGGSWVALN